MTNRRSTHNQICLRTNRAFSLVEMLMVIGVMALMVAMLLPALSGARSSAMKISTNSMMADLSTAAQRFSNDNAGRMPGYFSETLMGSADNWDGNNGVGMSATENVMLELGGADAIIGRMDDPDAASLVNPDSGIIVVGPSDQPENQVVVNINLIGSTGGYFTPETNQFKALEHGQGGQAGNPQGQGQELMPDLVDAWGHALLVWSQDQTARGSIIPSSSPDEVYTQFVRSNSDGPGNMGDLTGPAWFYYASNAAFLESTSFGNGSINMTSDPTTFASSAIGGGADETERLRSLATLLAAPSAYTLNPNIDGLNSASFEDIYPSTPRGRFIVHSAGRDGIFLNSHDSGWRGNAQTSGGNFHLNFGSNYVTNAGDRLTDDNDAYTNVDMIDEFDDITVSSK